jgi:hypothetical protein
MPIEKHSQHANPGQKSILDRIFTSDEPTNTKKEIVIYLELNAEGKETNPLEYMKKGFQF